MSRTIRNALAHLLCAALPMTLLCFGCASPPEEVTSSTNAVSTLACVNVPPADSGTYCGNDPANGFEAGSFDANQLVTCVNRGTATFTTCKGSCIIAGPGKPDHCNPDPCAQVAPKNNGLYCGKSIQNKFDTTDASPFFLYNCSGGKTTQSFFCVNGCTVANNGTPDHCS